MKKVILLALLATFINAGEVTCIDYGSGMQVCTDDQGNQTTIWTY